MDYGKAISFIPEDPRWITKLAIGTGLVLASIILTPILIGLVGYAILAGYAVRSFQNVRDGAAYPLPEWDQWGDDLTRGFKLFGVVIVWALPMIFLGFPYFIGGVMTNSRGGGQALGGLIMLCTGCLSFIYGLFFYLVSPGFLTWFAEDEQVSSGLQFTEIWNWTQKHLSQIVIAVIVVIIATFAIQLASWLGLILCIVGIIVTLPLGVLVASLYNAHVYGQLAHAFPTGHALAYAEPMPMPTPGNVAATSAVVTPPPAPIVPVEEQPSPPAAEELSTPPAPPSEEPPAPAAPEEPQPPVA